MAKGFHFIGIKPSDTALRRGWRWEDGHLAAKQLFDALRAAGIDPECQTYDNLFLPGPGIWVSNKALERARAARANGQQLVALGIQVSRQLLLAGLAHIPLTHPAARGTIRRKDRYAAHVLERLGQQGPSLVEVVREAVTPL